MRTLNELLTNTENPDAATGKFPNRTNPELLQRLLSVNKELWLILAIFVVSYLVNRAISAQRMAIMIYTLPTIFSAYVYGRRHAVMTAVFTGLVAFSLFYTNPDMIFSVEVSTSDKWFELASWAGMLVIIAYAMGSLYEAQNRSISELRKTYHGLLTMVQHTVSRDQQAQSHSFRVSVYASKIAQQLGFDVERCEDVRLAALLHDIGGSETNRIVLTKALELTGNQSVRTNNWIFWKESNDRLEDENWNLRRILPIVLEHYDRFHGAERNLTSRKDLPIEARILIVADVFDSLTIDRPYRRSLSIEEALKCIQKQSGTGFDPEVVQALHDSFDVESRESSNTAVVELRN